MKYQLEIDEVERAIMILCLGRGYDISLSSRGGEPVVQTTPADIARRLIELSQASPALQPRAGAPVPSDVAPAPGRRELWILPASNGTTKTGPCDDAELITLGPITPLAITKQGEGDKERLVVEWKDQGKSKRASCWVSGKAIWPRVLEKVRQSATFLVKEKSGYLNIVGVKP